MSGQGDITPAPVNLKKFYGSLTKDQDDDEAVSNRLEAQGFQFAPGATVFAKPNTTTPPTFHYDNPLGQSTLAPKPQESPEDSSMGTAIPTASEAPPISDEDIQKALKAYTAHPSLGGK